MLLPVCCICLVLLFLIITICVVFVLFGPTEKFSSNSPKWDKRMKELTGIYSIFYRGFFNNIDPRPTTKPSPQPGKIFVSVASYRDNQCLDTVRNLSENADRPNDLVIVVCQQNSLLEDDCLGWCKSDKDHPVCPIGNIERLSYLSARGPTWARWRIQRKWEGEEYYLQIDAHTRMVRGWDTILKEELARCPSEKPVLTQYPLEYDIVDKSLRNSPVSENWQTDKLRSGLYVQKFGEPDGFFRIQSNYTTEHRSSPFDASCWAAGFSFSRGDFFWEIGYDPYTPFLFFGEEMDIALRGWTHGWDFFSPSQTVVFHNYKRDHRKTFWENPMQKPLEILSRFRIYVRLGYLSPQDIPEKYRFILRDIDKYPLGTRRTLAEYEQKYGIDIKNEILNNKDE